MKLSKYFHYVELENEIYAIFNSLMMDVLFVDKNKLDDILKFNTPSCEFEILKNKGIYITDNSQDAIALDIVKKRYDFVVLLQVS